MATINWTCRRETFNPNKNYFEINNVEVSRETTEEENILSQKCATYSTWGVALAIFGVCTGLIGGIIFAATCIWWAFAVVVILSVTSLLFGTVGLLNKSEFYDCQLDQYHKDHDVWSTPEVKAIREYNAEQQRIAEEWRANHPLEEKIRACLLDPKSSVDVANLARFYAVEYLKGATKNEDLD